MAFCSRCGKELFDGRHSCPHCGENLNSKAIKYTPTAEEFIKLLISRILGLGWGVLTFWLGPKFMMSLNEKLGLPIFQSPNTKAIGTLMVYIGVALFFLDYLNIPRSADNWFSDLSESTSPTLTTILYEEVVM